MNLYSPLARSSGLIGFLTILGLASPSVTNCAGAPCDSRGGQFIGLKSFSRFETVRGPGPAEAILTSPVVAAQINWDQLIASWNADTPPGAYLKVEVRALYLDHTTKYFTLGVWSSDPTRFPRKSLPGQRDDDGDVFTDTLILRHPTDRLQIRVTLGGDVLERARLKFVGISLTYTKAELSSLPPNRAAWGRLIAVPERSQMDYPNGKVLCSPTTVSMLMTYWSQQLHRPELDKEVPEIAAAVYDANWKGTGNWPFNTAYAGSYRGMRAYVTRMSDVSELENWIAVGIPVGISVCYDRLRGKGPGPNGHLVVCVGFTEDGDPIINDPGTSKNVRKIFSRKNLVYAWSYSRNAAYLIYPEDSEIPTDRFGHWDSWSARQRIRFE